VAGGATGINQHGDESRVGLLPYLRLKLFLPGRNGNHSKW